MTSKFLQSLFLSSALASGSAVAQDAPTSLIGSGAMASFFDCATHAMGAVAKIDVNLVNPAIEILSELGERHMIVSVEQKKTPGMSGVIVMSAEWRLDKDAEPPAFFNRDGMLATSFTITEPPRVVAGVVSGLPTVTNAKAAVQDAGTIDVTITGNANSNSQLRTQVSQNSERIARAIFACHAPEMN